MEPTLGHGKVCYVEIPALDVERSSRFYDPAGNVLGIYQNPK